MQQGSKNKLKITFVTSLEANKNIESLLYKNIAKTIYNDPEFQRKLCTVKKGNEISLDMP